MTDSCPFCHLLDDQLVWSSDLVVAFRDRYPVNEGHTLIITRRHIATYFEASPWEQQEIWRAVGELKHELDEEFQPSGYNVGFNAGWSAGQTVPHLHVHVIPRFDGDVPDPTGGVRGVIPEKQNYLTSSNEWLTSQVDKTKSVTEQAEQISDDAFAELPRFVPGEKQHFADALQEAIAIADAIDIVVAFVQTSGLDMLRPDLEEALERGSRVRILTGDSLGITNADALRRLMVMDEEFEACTVRFYRGAAANTTFHPKAYLFARGPHGIAYVGSSNLSRSALTKSVEWNLRSVPSEYALFQTLRDHFERLFRSPKATCLTREVICSYEQVAPVPLRPEPRSPIPTAHSIQEEALDALRGVRNDGAQRGLVVMASGLGKTYLSAMDFRQTGGERALFVAHREEILDQARKSWVRFFPDKLVGLFKGSKKEFEADLVFASVQTLSRPENLHRFGPTDFDYLVIDEFHHAAAATYRRLIGYFRPKFLLGLTATPDRMDGASLLVLCDDRLVFRAGLFEGIHRQLLIPFRYFGVRDEVDYTPIPWRSGRFDVDELTRAVSTHDRAAQALREYYKHAPDKRRRTIAFCCSIAHSDYMATYFRSQGVEAVSIHSANTSAPRNESLRRLRDGKLEIICCVDVFNEGVDVPSINVVLMLRPTESPIVFLQQLGRGLRRDEDSGKTHLTVVDFIGNHRSFLAKPQSLLALTGQDLPAPVALKNLREGKIDLPDGCSVDIETTAIDMLEKLVRHSKEDLLLYAYSSLRNSHGRRPTASELFEERMSFDAVKHNYGTWFDFVAAQGDLTDDESRALDRYRSWFADLAATKMSRSYKMIVLRSLIDRGRFFGRDTVDALAAHAWEQLRTDLLLRAELDEYLKKPNGQALFNAMWRSMPLTIWAKAESTSQPWFELDGNAFVSLIDVAEEDRNTVEAMTLELAEFRLAQRRDTLRRKALEQVGHPILMKVSHTGGNPILRFDRTVRSDIPQGEVQVEVDGEIYTFRFMKIAVNVATDLPGGPNVLPRLMRAWFGPTAGLPGTLYRVRLIRHGKHWRLRPDEAPANRARVLPFPTLPFYETLDIACDAAMGTIRPGPHPKTDIAVTWDDPLDAHRHFVVRAKGDSMDGGPTPIPDGSLVLCELVDATSPDDIEGQACLVAGKRADEKVLAAIKVPILTSDGWILRSWSPKHPDTEVPRGVTLRIVGRVLGTVDETPDPQIGGRQPSCPLP